MKKEQLHRYNTEVNNNMRQKKIAVESGYKSGSQIVYDCAIPL